MSSGDDCSDDGSCPSEVEYDSEEGYSYAGSDSDEEIGGVGAAGVGAGASGGGSAGAGAGGAAGSRGACGMFSVKPRVLEDAEFDAFLEQLDEEYASLLGLPKWQARILLVSTQWNTDRLQEQMFTRRETTLESAGVVEDAPAIVEPSSTDPSPAEASGVESTGAPRFDCSICCDDFAFEDTTAISCGHRFCNTCWKNNVECKLPSKDIVLEHCMEHQCQVKIPEILFKRLLKPADFAKYQRWVRLAYVESPWTRLIKWCPTPSCGRPVMHRGAADVTGTDLIVTCECGEKWCFGCCQESHLPATCEHVSAWLTRASQSDMSAMWIKANTKNCPKCDLQLSKMDNTCAKMKCGRCHHTFCWLCLRPYSEHGAETGGFYACTKFERRLRTEGRSEEEKERVKAARQLRNYDVAAERHLTHKAAKSTAELDLLPAARRHAVEIARAELADADTLGFLDDAVAAVIRSRQVLMWSHVYKFYLSLEDDADDVERLVVLFEDYQLQLESMTEDLHHRIEEGFMENFAGNGGRTAGASAAAAGAGGAASAPEAYEKWREGILRLSSTVNRFANTVCDVDSFSADLKNISWQARDDVQETIDVLSGQGREFPVWAWQDDSGTWNPYPESAIARLEAALTSSASGKPKSPVPLKIGDRQYEVNISTMRQTNLGTGGHRPVRRTLEKQARAWACEACSFRNGGEAKRCAVCDTPRGET